MDYRAGGTGWEAGKSMVTAIDHVTIISADMINMFRLKFVPSCCVWLYAGGAATPAVAW